MNKIKPKWINLSTFIKVLRCDETQEELSIRISKHASSQDGYITDSHEGDAKRFFPSLLGDIRMFDITDSNYWGVSFIGVFIFLLIEILIFMSYNFPIRLLFLIPTALFILVVLYLTAFFYFLHDKEVPDFVYTLPVILTSLSLISFNFLLIWYTGWQRSPFLPAFLFTNLTIISAPRENSWGICGITFVAFIILLSPFLCGFEIEQENGQNNNQYSDLSNTINMLTLVFTVGIVFFSRFFSSKQVLNKQRARI